MSLGNSPLILFSLMMEVTLSSKTSVLTRITQRHFPEEDIFTVTTLATPNLIT
jgi:hypothetical protein